MQTHLLLIDGHHLMYRAYYAIPRTLKTAAGEQTNVLYGVASMLLSMLRAERPDSLLFCFDAGEETFRHQENATYKEGRAETPDEFFVQIPRVIQMIDAFGLAHLSEPRYEADDFLCAYAKLADREGMRVTIVTGDRDAFQLANDNVRIAIPHKAYQQPEYLGPSEILAKYGVRPDQIVSYKGLTGDASDNLPGVKGIGPKTAASLLQQYGTLEGIYEHLSEIKPTVRGKLERDREQAFFCERMAQLICDMPLPLSLDSLTLRDMPVAEAIAFLREVEFLTLAKRFQSLLDSDYGRAHFRMAELTPSAVPTARKTEEQLSLF